MCCSSARKRETDAAAALGIFGRGGQDKAEELGGKQG